MSIFTLTPSERRRVTIIDRLDFLARSLEEATREFHETTQSIEIEQADLASELQELSTGSDDSEISSRVREFYGQE